MTTEIQAAIEAEDLDTTEIPECSRYTHEYKVVRFPVNETDIRAIYPYRSVCGVDFYMIDGDWWQFSHVGSDSKGVYACFYRNKGEFKGF